ncbi:MAG: restriction endonuclease subunit S [Thermoanaerobaculia bacterium]
MRKGWQKKSLGELCAFTSGGTPSKSNPRYWAGKFPFVSARDLKSERIANSTLHISKEAIEMSATKVAPVGSLLMLVRGMGLANGIQIGEVVSPVAFNQDIRALHPPLDSVLPRFLLLALKNCFVNGGGNRALSSAAHGTLKIDTAALLQIAVLLPPLPEQQRIVAVLDESFAGLATAKANAEKNLQNARALFEDHVQSIFSQKGEGWVEKRLEDLCTFSSGGTPTKSNRSFWSGKIPWISGRDMKATRLSDSFLHISQAAVDRSATRMAPAGSLLLLVRGMGLAHGPQIAELMVPCAFNQDIKGIHSGPDLVPRFLLFALRHQIQSNDNVLSSAAHGTLKIDADGLRGLEIPVPPRKQQERIVTTIDALAAATSDLAHVYERKLVALDSLKKSLLHQAFNGEL